MELPILVGFHVRRGDKHEWVRKRNGGSLPDGPETLEHMRQTIQGLGRILGLRRSQVEEGIVFAVASDEPDWCKENLIDPRGRINVVHTHDRVRSRSFSE